MFFISDLVGCGNKADELKAESLEDEESRDLSPERAVDLANKLRALKVKHSVIKKERDQLLVEKRESLSPVREVKENKEDTSVFLRQIKGLESQLKIEREKVVILDDALLANKEIERSLEVSREENKNLHMHLETTKELAISRQERIDELEARSRADKTQLEVMKVKYDGGKSTDSQAMQQAVIEANASKLALKMAKEELELLRSKIVESEARTTVNQQQLTSLQTRLDTMTAQKKSADLSLEMAQGELLGMQKRMADIEQSINNQNGSDAISAAGNAEKLRLLQQQVTEHKDANAVLTKERNDLLSVKAKLEAQVTELERQLKRDRSQLAIIQQESDQIVQSAMTAARGEVGTYRDRINELELQSRKDRERSAQIQREFDELITGRIVSNGESPTRLADRCKAVKDKLEAASIRSKALISGFLEQDENDQALFDENNDGLSEERRGIAELVARERGTSTADTVPVVALATWSSVEH